MSASVRDNYDCIGGKYFTADGGKHVPLNDRPDELVDAIERPFRGEDGIHEVCTVAGLVKVYSTGWSADELRQFIHENTEARVTLEKQVDNRLKKNVPKEADDVFIFKLI